MSVKFTQDAEVERINNREKETNQYHLFFSESLVEAVRWARDNGWKEKKVQVREESTGFFVEPYEEGCGCRGLLKYKDYFD